MTLLEVDGLCVNYGRIEAIRDVTFAVEEGAVVTLIGANGAGKTTTLKTLSGLRKVRAGAVRFQGKDITAMPPHLRVPLGISQSPEGRRIFPGMSVLENLDMGAFSRADRVKTRSADLERVFTLFPRLEERREQLAGTMSGGEQQMLAMGRALMSRPKLIQQIFAIINDIREQGTTILLVEQNAMQALRIADRAYILETGEVVREGTGDDLVADDSVRAAYLGGDV